MKQAFTIITPVLLFFVMCSMSKCKDEDKTPGPATTVHGIVKDLKSGDGYGGIVLQINKQYGRGLACIDCGPGYSDYDTVVTKNDGTYNLKFTPLGTGTFTLRIIKSPIAFNGGYNETPIIIGQDNTLNYSPTKLINLSVHLKNTTDHSRKNFQLFCYDQYNTYYYSVTELYKVAADTNFVMKAPHLSKISMVSKFSNGYYADTLSYRQALTTSKKDTSISIVNP